MSTLLFRDVRPDDDALLALLFASVKRAEFAASGLPAPMVEALVASQATIERASRAQQFPRAQHRIVSVDGVDVGRVMIDRDAERVLLVDVTILPSHRGQGTGARVLSALLAQAHPLSLHLTVRHENPAVRLYERAGFVVVDRDAMHLHMRSSPTPVAPQSVAGPRPRVFA